MEQNFEKFLSMLAHGEQPFVVYNDVNSYGELTISIAVACKSEYGKKQKTLTIYKYHSFIDEDTGAMIMRYIGQTVETDEEYNTLSSFVKVWENENDSEDEI